MISLLIVSPIMGLLNCSMFSCVLLYVHSSFAIIFICKKELVALLSLSSLWLLCGSFSWCVCSLWLWYIWYLLTSLNVFDSLLSSLTYPIFSITRAKASLIVRPVAIEVYWPIISPLYYLEEKDKTYTDVNKNASSRSIHEYLLDWKHLIYDIYCIITSDQSCVSPAKGNFAEKIFQVETTSLVWDIATNFILHWILSFKYFVLFP